MDRWESDAINALEQLPNTLDQVRVSNFIENHLGTTTRNMMNSGEINYPTDYQHLIDIVDNTYNVITRVSQIILGIDPSRQDSLIQDTTTRDLEKLHLDSFNDMHPYLGSFVCVDEVFVRE